MVDANRRTAKWLALGPKEKNNLHFSFAIDFVVLRSAGAPLIEFIAFSINISPLAGAKAKNSLVDL